MKKNSEIKALAKKQIAGSRGEALLVCLLFSTVLGVSGAVVVGPIILGGPLSLGFSGYFLNKARGKSAGFADLFDAFKSIGGNSQFGQSILLYILRGLFTWLWTLLFIIPGIIKNFSYSQAFYIMKDNRNIEAMDAITQSRHMMNGHKWHYFTLGLSFIGWFLLFCVPFLGAFVLPDAFVFFAVLGGLALLVGSVWLLPYIIMCFTLFYEELRKGGGARTPAAARKPAAKKPAAKKPAAKKPSAKRK